MIQLPDYVRRLPYLFYALGLILGGWRFLNEWVAIEATYGTSGLGFDDRSFNLAHATGRSAAIYSGVADLVYIAASGGIIQVLIGIFDKMKGPGE